MAVASLKHEAQIQFPGNEGMVVGDVAAWIQALPAHARLEVITREVGHQRDPYTLAVGLRATWEE